MHPLSTEAQTRTETATQDGSANAATVHTPPSPTKVDVYYSATGSAVLTIEVSTDGTTWREADTVSFTGSNEGFQQYDFAYRHVRAWLSDNTDTVEIVAGGL